ncbi:hypothetical protein SESBI_14027 [Sesbania bispinosa]|nr:hypothetical protein SESBI_14027 [Sesbania bispinosa]
MLQLFICWNWGMCTTTQMHVNNPQTQGNIYVICSGNKNYEKSKVIPPNGETKIPLPPQGSKVWPPVTCIGKVGGFANKEYILYLSTSNDRTKRCEGGCLFSVANNKFYRWDPDQETWIRIPPTIWYPKLG